MPDRFLQDDRSSPEPESVECACGKVCDEDEVFRCVICGIRCCRDCGIYLDEWAEWVCNEGDEIKFLLKVIAEQDEYIHRLIAEQNKKDRLAAAAKKASITGNRSDLHEYLKIRKEFI